MKVRELIEVSPSCNVLEVIVRENGISKWIQGYLIGKDIDYYPSFQRKDVIEHYDDIAKRKLKPNQESDGAHGYGLPMKLIKKSVSNAPDYVLDLEVAHIQPRHIPSYHKDKMTHNDYQLDVSAYPDGWHPIINENIDNIKKDVDDQLDGQMDINDFLGE